MAHSFGTSLARALQEEDLLAACRQGTARVSASASSLDKPAASSAQPSASTVSASSASVEVTSDNPLGGESLIESRVMTRTYTYEASAACRHLLLVSQQRVATFVCSGLSLL